MNELSEIETLKKEINELKEKLKKYTAPKRNKLYYQNNKEEIKKSTNYKEKIKRAYEKRKLKKIENENIDLEKN